MTDKSRDGDQDGSGAQRYREALNASAQLLRANRPGEAARVLEQLAIEYPDDVDIAINLGGALIMQRKWSQAVRFLEAATQTQPMNAMLWMNLGAAYLGQLETSGPKQQEQAISAYERALQIEPMAPNVHYHLGLIHKERGNLKRAAAHFQRAIEIDPGDKDAQFWLRKIDVLLMETYGQSDGTKDDTAEDHGQEPSA